MKVEGCKVLMTDGLTDEPTFVIVETLSRPKFFGKRAGFILDAFSFAVNISSNSLAKATQNISEIPRKSRFQNWYNNSWFVLHQI